MFEQDFEIMSTLKNRNVFYLIILFAVITRIWGIGDIASFTGDEGLHVPASENYLASGHSTPDYWFHPPLKHLLLAGSIKIFGNNPYGWRMRNALFGILSVIAIFLVGKTLFPDDIRIAYLSAALLAIDPLHIRLSISTAEEIQAACFFLLSLYFSSGFIKGKLVAGTAAGCFLGLAMASKWYYIPAALILVFFVLSARRQQGELTFSGTLAVLSSYITLPIGVYLSVFYAWFNRGYGIGEFVQMQIDTYRELQAVLLTDFNNKLAPISSPLAWFVKPVLIGFDVSRSQSIGQFSILMNNPPVWLFAIPAVLYTIYRGWKDRDRSAMLIAGFFCATYAQFLMVNRPIFIYSAIACLPFVCLAVAFLIISMLSRIKNGEQYETPLIAVIFLWGIYLYPFISYKPVPRFLYEPLLSLGTIYKPF